MSSFFVLISRKEKIDFAEIQFFYESIYGQTSSHQYSYFFFIPAVKHFNQMSLDFNKVTISSFSSCFFVSFTVLYQKRFKKERKQRVRIQQKLDTETKRRNQIEDALKASGAPAEALRLLSGKYTLSITLLFFFFSFQFDFVASLAYYDWC